MNERHIIEAALERRFARATVPECPPGPWGPTTGAPLQLRRRSRGFAYACAALAILLSAGIATQASDVLRAGYAHLFPFGGSSKPLPGLIHRADRLTIAQAQQLVPFPIVVPVGLPPNTTFQYASAVGGRPIPGVGLMYQTKIGGLYYLIAINETTAVSGPPVAHFEAIGKGKDGRTHHRAWTVPLRRWKHGDLIMEMFPGALPDNITDRIVRENTL